MLLPVAGRTRGGGRRLTGVGNQLDGCVSLRGETVTFGQGLNPIVDRYVT